MSVTDHIDISVDEPQFLNVGHLLLEQQVHLLLVLLQVLLLRLQRVKLCLQARFDLLHLDGFVPGGQRHKQRMTAVRSNRWSNTEQKKKGEGMKKYFFFCFGTRNTAIVNDVLIYCAYLAWWNYTFGWDGTYFLNIFRKYVFQLCHWKQRPGTFMEQTFVHKV